MIYKSFKTWLPATIQIGLCAVGIALPLLVACGGKISPGDSSTTSGGTPPFEVAGSENFLVFPNPLSSPAIDSPEYAQAYYSTVDPNNDRDTLAKWKALNHFGDPTTGVEQHAVFGDVRDLGYGRNLTARWNNDGTWAFMVDNYSVAPSANYAYSSLNVEAAVSQDKQWYGGTNAIEISPSPECTLSGSQLTQALFVDSPKTNPKCKYIAKFFNFDPVTGVRNTQVNLDGLGKKAMPGVCLACHGGRGDEIQSNFTPALFPYFGNPASEVRGDVKGRLHFFEVDAFDFSTQPGYTRADQEATLKILNQWVLDTYPMPSSSGNLYGASAVDPSDQDRPAPEAWGWQSPAADVLKCAYGGLPCGVTGMPNPTYADNYVPASWVSDGQTTLYNNVVKPACRVCHLLRGVAGKPDIDFSTFTGFQNFADKIRDHVVDRGNMPLSRILNDRYWATPSMNTTLDQFLANSNPVYYASAVTFSDISPGGSQLRPGRPIADFGPDRLIGASTSQVSATFSAQWSLFADTFSWRIASAPSGATANLSSTSGTQTTFTATGDGQYIVELIASKGSTQSAPVTRNIVVKTGVWPALANSVPIPLGETTSNPYPGYIKFQHVKSVLQKTCTTCHTSASSALGNKSATAKLEPPILYDNFDRNGDGLIQSGVNGADDIALYEQVLSFVNFMDISNSQLLRHPAGYAHAGNVLKGFGQVSGTSCTAPSCFSGDTLLPGNAKRDAYDMFINWILEGAPYP
jgi:hypothetical protein